MYGTNVHLFLGNKVEISSKGYCDFTAKVTVPVTGPWSTKGKNVGHYF